MTRLGRVLDDAVQRLGDGDTTQCATHRPCKSRRLAAERLRSVRESDDDQQVRRALAAAYTVEKQHPSFGVLAPEPDRHAGGRGSATTLTTRRPSDAHEMWQRERDGGLWTLTYVSHAPRPPSTEELDRILEVSHRNNARLGITGVLQCDGTTFAQTLEGDVDAVASLFGRISTDRRHSDVTILRSASISLRRYAEWRMALDRL